MRNKFIDQMNAMFRNSGEEWREVSIRLCADGTFEMRNLTVAQIEQVANVLNEEDLT